jgi:hypothetical protein
MPQMCISSCHIRIAPNTICLMANCGELRLVHPCTIYCSRVEGGGGGALGDSGSYVTPLIAGRADKVKCIQSTAVAAAAALTLQ